MTPIGEEQLMAYADGELSGEEAAAVAAAIAADPALKARLDQHIRLRAKVSDAFADVAMEPTPDALKAAIETPTHAPAELVDLEAVRQAKETLAKAQRKPARSRIAPWALAAGLVALALVVGAPLLRRPSSVLGGQLVAMAGGGMTATPVLAGALDRELASQPQRSQRVAIGLTFRDKKGVWCRSFTAAEDGLAGLACRESGRWRVKVLAAAPHGSGAEFQVAGSSTPAPVQSAIDAVVAGAPLDAAAERRVRDSGWR